MLPVDETYLDIGEAFMHPGGKMIGTVKAAMPASRTAEAYAEVRESPFNVIIYMRRHKLLYASKKHLHFPLRFKKLDDRGIGAGEAHVLLISAGIVHSAAVKHITASVLGSGNAILV